MTDAENDLNLVRAVADYQFGRGIGERLFPEGVKLVYSKRTGRVRHIYLGGRLLATLRPTDGLLSLTLDGARRLMEANGRRRYWVKVSREASPYVARGRSVFAKHVVDVDVGIRPGEEVAVLSEDGEVIAVGRALLSGREMLQFRHGVAVKVRAGSDRQSK